MLRTLSLSLRSTTQIRLVLCKRSQQTFPRSALLRVRDCLDVKESRGPFASVDADHANARPLSARARIPVHSSFIDFLSLRADLPHGQLRGQARFRSRFARQPGERRALGPNELRTAGALSPSTLGFRRGLHRVQRTRAREFAVRGDHCVPAPHIADPLAQAHGREHAATQGPHQGKLKRKDDQKKEPEIGCSLNKNHRK